MQLCNRGVPPIQGCSSTTEVCPLNPGCSSNGGIPPIQGCSSVTEVSPRSRAVTREGGRAPVRITHPPQLSYSRPCGTATARPQPRRRRLQTRGGQRAASSEARNQQAAASTPGFPGKRRGATKESCCPGLGQGRASTRFFCFTPQPLTSYCSQFLLTPGAVIWCGFPLFLLKKLFFLLPPFICSVRFGEPARREEGATSRADYPSSENTATLSEPHPLRRRRKANSTPRVNPGKEEKKTQKTNQPHHLHLLCVTSSSDRRWRRINTEGREKHRVLKQTARTSSG